MASTPAEGNKQPAISQADDISNAVQRLLESLAPEARAALLLRVGFGASYAEVARSVGLSEAACRALVRDAKLRLRHQRPR